MSGVDKNSISQKPHTGILAAISLIRPPLTAISQGQVINGIPVLIIYMKEISNGVDRISLSEYTNKSYFSL